MGMGPNYEPESDGRSSEPGGPQDKVNGLPRGSMLVNGGKPGQSFGTAAANYAMGNQEDAYKMLQLFLTGQNNKDDSRFGRFMQGWLGPVASAALNALTNTTGQAPTSTDDLFGNIQSGLAGDTNIYDYLKGLGGAALQKVLTGPAGESDVETQRAMELYAPLLTMGLSPLERTSFYRQQDDTIQQMDNRRLTDPNLGIGTSRTVPGTDQGWGQFVQESPFYKRYSGR